MNIAYVSDILNIHDYRFLKGLSESQNRVWVIAPGVEIPENIRNLPNLEFIQIRFPAKWDLKRFMAPEALWLRVRHHARRAYIGVIERSPLLQKWVGYADWAQTDDQMLKAYAASGLSWYLVHHFSRELRRINPDLVHASWVSTGGLLTALADFHPFLLMPWGSDVLVLPDMSAAHIARARYAIGNADMITCNSESIKRRIIELSGYPADKIIVIPWGIDLGLFNPEHDGTFVREKLGWEDKKVLVMTRFFKPVYGIEFFVRALPQVIEQEPDTRVLLIGSGPLEIELRDLVSRLRLSNHVHFTGFIPNEQLAPYLNAANVYVSTSLSDGTSLSMLEAMACALPVVVTDVSSYSEWVQHGLNGFIVPRKDPQATAEKTLMLLKDGNLARRMGERNLVVAQEKADMHKNFTRLEQIYFDLANDTGTARRTQL